MLNISHFCGVFCSVGCGGHSASLIKFIKWFVAYFANRQEHKDKPWKPPFSPVGYTFLLQAGMLTKMRRRKTKTGTRTDKRANLQLLRTRSTPQADTTPRTALLRILAPPPTWTTASTETANTSRACRSRCVCEYSSTFLYKVLQL